MTPVVTFLMDSTPLLLSYANKERRRGRWTGSSDEDRKWRRLVVLLSGRGCPSHSAACFCLGGNPEAVVDSGEFYQYLY